MYHTLEENCINTWKKIVLIKIPVPWNPSLFLRYISVSACKDSKHKLSNAADLDNK